MTKSSQHLLKRGSLFSMFCLSYSPLFLLLSIKTLIENKEFAHFGSVNIEAFLIFLEHFGFISLLAILSFFAVIGTYITFSNLESKSANAFPARVDSIKSKNDEALSYLATYIIPLLSQGALGLFEYATFIILFIIYYRLYSTSSLIVVNPVLNMKYGLYELDYTVGANNQVSKNALIISKHKWIEEGDELLIIKLSHRLYFAY
ncbi:MAG: hypothetical protein RIT38_432 [Bacteroidota bacterium]